MPRIVESGQSEMPASINEDSTDPIRPSDSDLDVLVAKPDFEEAMRKFIDDKQNSGEMQIWDDNEVAYTIKMIHEYYAAKHGGKKRNYIHYNKARLYDVIRSEGKECLIYKKKKASDRTIIIPPLSRYFELITWAHTELCHGGRDRTRFLLQTKYKIPKWAVELYLKLCPICQRKKIVPRSGLVVKPILSNHFNQRCQVDLMDFQSVPDGEYRWLLQYQDHLTKFCILRPLKSKKAEEVAGVLFDIFCIFGCPKILQSDNGREFVNKVVEELVEMWPDCRIVHGRPRYPQSQGSIERANADAANMLRAYMTEKKTRHWAKACLIVQYRKNCALNRTIKRSPYEALFGERPATEMIEIDEAENADDPSSEHGDETAEVEPNLENIADPEPDDDPVVNHTSVEKLAETRRLGDDSFN